MARLKVKAPKKTDPVADHCRQQAEHLIEIGKIGEAVGVLERAYSQYPKNHEVLYQYARILRKDKQLKRAAAILRELLEIKPNHVSALVALARINTKFGNSKKPFELMKRAVELVPERADIQAGFANALQRIGALPQAIEHYKKAIEIRLGQPVKKANSEEKAEAFNTAETEGILWDTLAMFARNGVHGFASHGTLLGLVREGGLLPHDKDIDIGIPYSEIIRATTCLERNGWKRQPGNFGLINPISFLHLKSGLTLDLCGFSVEKGTGKTLYGFWMDSIPKNWNRFIELDEISLIRSKCPQGRDVWSVEDPEVIFLPFYGNWRVPDKNFEGVIGEPGLRGASLLTQCYGLNRIFNSLSKGDKQRAAKQAGMMKSHLPDERIYQDILVKIS